MGRGGGGRRDSAAPRDRLPDGGARRPFPLYGSEAHSAPGPGTKVRTRGGFGSSPAKASCCPRGLRETCGCCAVVGTSGFTTREYVLLATSSPNEAKPVGL